MRSFLLVLFGGLIAVGALLAVQWTPPGRAAATPALAATGDKAAIGRIVRDYILANPEVLVEAMQELEKKQDSDRSNVAQKAIKTYEGELLRDAESPVGGNPNGNVVIVEFNDYQCPYCKRAYVAVKAVAKADGNVKIIHKDLPILGEASKIASLAALASVKQGKHAELHAAFMENNARLDRGKILEIAGSVGLDVAKLERDMQDPALQRIIERNMAIASALGVRGTPAFVIGNQFVPGAVDADALKQLIAEARKGKG
jgi:protein-disulfide isomerase